MSGSTHGAGTSILAGRLLLALVGSVLLAAAALGDGQITFQTTNASGAPRLWRIEARAGAVQSRTAIDSRQRGVADHRPDARCVQSAGLAP